MKKTVGIFILLVLGIGIRVSAQRGKQATNLSADLQVGVPYMFTNVGNDFNNSFAGSLRYSFSREFSIQGQLTHLNISGSNSSANSSLLGGFPAASDGNIKSYSMSNDMYSIVGMLNLTPILKKNDQGKLNLYVYAGGGLMYHDVSYTLVNNVVIKLNDTYTSPFYVYRLGAQAKYYLNYAFDVSGGIAFDYVDTYWLDGAPNDEGYNNILSINVGISYKVLANKNKDLIDWNLKRKKKAKPVEKIPVIKKPIVKPTPPVTEVPKKDTTKLAVVIKPVDSVKVVKPIETVKEPVKQPVAVVPPTPKVENTPNTNPAVANSNTRKEFGEPDSVYNVVMGCYTIRSRMFAVRFRNKLIAKGYDAKVFRSKGSRYYRVMAISTGDRQLALSVLKECRENIEPNAWMHVYYKH
ncbi:MAG: hypothetical protein V4643_02700 [Bacteroidota bacterium]